MFARSKFLIQKLQTVLKIFTESPDEFVLVLFGNNETKNPFSSTLNIYYCEEEMQLPTFDWLKYLENEVKVSEEVEGDCKFHSYHTSFIVAGFERKIDCFSFSLFCNINEVKDFLSFAC